MAVRALSAAVVVGLLPAALGFQIAVNVLTPVSAGACPRFHGLNHGAACGVRPSPDRLLCRFPWVDRAGASLHMTRLRMCMHGTGRASVFLRLPRAAPSSQRHRTPALRLHPPPPAMKLAMGASFEDMVAAAGTRPLHHIQIRAKPGRREGGVTRESGGY
jgi:hypothetical protein